MINEELEKKANESYWNNSDASGGLSSRKNYTLGFIAGAKELQEETLREIIEIEKVSDYRWEENQYLKQQNEQLEKQIKDLESQLKDIIEDNDYYQKENEKMKNHANCKFFHEWNLSDIMDEPLDDLSPCQGCKNFSLWEPQNE